MENYKDLHSKKGNDAEADGNDHGDNGSGGASYVADDNDDDEEEEEEDNGDGDDGVLQRTILTEREWRNLMTKK